MFSKISVRNIPNQIFQALEALAERHDRSTEAEVRQAIRAWVNPLLVGEARNARRQAVAGRLNRMLQQVNSDRPGAKLLPSHIAEEIGEERAEEVEAWFLGETEPSFPQLVAIARLLGVDSDWLKHGDKALYPPHHQRLSENPLEAVRWLLQWDTEPNGEKSKLEALHLIRTNDQTGSLYLVKESNRGHFVVYETGIHVSEEIGSGGEAMLAALFVTLELLYKRYSTFGESAMVLGYLLPPDDVAQLTSGNTNPGAVLREGTRSTWWEDIWDNKMASKHSYWSGWYSLHERIGRVIATRKNLNEIRAQIHSGLLHEKSSEAA